MVVCARGRGGIGRARAAWKVSAELDWTLDGWMDAPCLAGAGKFRVSFARFLSFHEACFVLGVTRYENACMVPWGGGLLLRVYPVLTWLRWKGVVAITLLSVTKSCGCDVCRW